jgi:hypothetical protein
VGFTDSFLVLHPGDGLGIHAALANGGPYQCDIYAAGALLLGAPE